MLSLITSLANICGASTGPECKPFNGFCALPAFSRQQCRPDNELELPSAAEFRRSAWYVSLTVNDFYPDDETLLAELRPYLRYRIECVPVDSIMLAYLHHRDSRDQQKNELTQGETQISVPGIRAQQLETGWRATRYGQHYQELITDFHDIWGGGQFSQAF
jgi:hypothetical protein